MISFGKLKQFSLVGQIAVSLMLVGASSTCLANDSLGLASGFNAFVKEDFQTQYTDMQGRLAAGGDVTLNGYGLASSINIPAEVYSLVSGGDILFTNGMIYAGSVITSGSAAGIGQGVINVMAAGSTITDGAQLPFDFGAEFTYLEQVSSSLALAEDTGSITYQWGGTYLQGDCTSNLQVFNLDGPTLLSSHTLGMECVPSEATIVFNVSGTAPGLQNMGLAHLQPSANKIIWNFYEAESVQFSSIGVEGSVLAPNADLNTPWGYVNGTVMVNSWAGNMELHHVPFEGDITSLLSSEAPVIITPPVELGFEATPYSYDVDAIDEDIGDVLTHSIDSAPMGFSIDPTTGVITWLAPQEYVGTVPDFNQQCYVVPTGSVGVVEEGDEIPDGRIAVISPLFKRVKDALEVSAGYTARESVAWDKRNGCLGCHIQTQSLLGLETSIDKVEVDQAAIDYLVDALFSNQQANGTITSHGHRTTYLNNQTSLALWSLTSYPDRLLSFDARIRALDFFVTRANASATSVSWPNDHNTGWMNNALPVTALVSQAGAYLLEDLYNPDIEFSDVNFTTIQTFEERPQ